MWIFFIIIVVLAVCFVIFKNKIKLFIQKRVKEKNKIDNTSVEYIYKPMGFTRTFSINFTIEETGDGNAKIYIENRKRSDIIS